MVRSFVSWLRAGALLVAPVLLSAQSPPGVRIDTTLVIPMRDGARLGADLWRPLEDRRYPVLVYRTPYDRREAGGASGVALAAVRRGYAVLLQDVRGRYGSEGSFEPYRHEGQDGYDTIEWAAGQSWSTGDVGSFGLSYPGAVQWMAAVEQPPHLKAMVPAMTYSTPESFWYSGGVWDGSWLDWVWFNIAPDLRRRLDQPGPRTDEEAASAWTVEEDRLRRHRPLATLPDFQVIAPWYAEWMRHPPRDPWWGWANLAGKYSMVSAAVLNLSGWFDEPYGPQGAVRNYQGITATGRFNRTELILGPWTHGVGAIGRSKAGDRDFGPTARLSYDSLVLEWMDRKLRSRAPTDRPEPVHVFVMGANQWRHYPAWPPVGQVSDTLSLHPAGRGESSGALNNQAVPAEPSSRFASDPDRPLADPYQGRPGAHDYSALVGRPELLSFETAPFEAAYEIIGAVTAELSVRATVPDFDLWIQLYDVSPDGTAWNLSGHGAGLLRASYREGGPNRKPLTPGQPVRVVLDRLHTANRFLPGHRLRLVISAAFVPYFSVNPQTGDQEFDSTRNQLGSIEVLHSPDWPSRLLLPVVHSPPE